MNTKGESFFVARLFANLSKTVATELIHPLFYKVRRAVLIPILSKLEGLYSGVVLVMGDEGLQIAVPVRSCLTVANRGFPGVQL